LFDILLCIPPRADAGRGARRGGALPDGDRQRPVPGQGTFPPSFLPPPAAISAANYSLVNGVQVFGFVRLAELYYAGSHGMDIRGPTVDASNHGEVKKTFLFLLLPNKKNIYISCYKFTSNKTHHSVAFFARPVVTCNQQEQGTKQKRLTFVDV
jgi:hypothetical protein